MKRLLSCIKRHPWLSVILGLFICYYLMIKWNSMYCPWFLDKCSMEEVEFVLSPRGERNRNNPKWNTMKIRVPKAYVEDETITDGQVTWIQLALRYPEMTPWRTSGKKGLERTHYLRISLRLSPAQADLKAYTDLGGFKKTNSVFDGMEEYTFNDDDPESPYHSQYYFPALHNNSSLDRIACSPLALGNHVWCNTYYMIDNLSGTFNIPHIYLAQWRHYEAAVIKFIKEHSTIVEPAKP